MYSRASLVLLDDVFSTQSAVDAQCMITRLLGPRCPLRQGMTVIIATRAAEMFAEYANRIIRITNTGTLTPFVPLHGNIDGGNNGLVQQLDGQCPSADMDKVQKLSEEVTSRFRVLAEPNRARRKPPYSLFLDQMNKPVAVACLVTLLLFGIFETLPRKFSSSIYSSSTKTTSDLCSELATVPQYYQLHASGMYLSDADW